MMKKTLWMKWLSILCLLCAWSANAYSEKLVFSEEGETVKILSLDVLKKQLLTHQIDIYDPQYAKDKRYLAFSLHDVMALAYGKSWGEQAMYRREIYRIRWLSGSFLF